MSDLSQVFEMDDILRVSIVSQVEHHLYFPESFLCTLCMNVPYHFAENTFRKNRRITIRLYDHDFKGIQKKAFEMGIPYQTLISSMIHRYIEGDLVEKNVG